MPVRRTMRYINCTANVKRREREEGEDGVGRGKRMRLLLQLIFTSPPLSVDKYARSHRDGLPTSGWCMVEQYPFRFAGSDASACQCIRDVPLPSGWSHDIGNNT